MLAIRLLVLTDCATWASSVERQGIGEKESAKIHSASYNTLQRGWICLLNEAITWE